MDVYGLIGNPVGHSLSPPMHEAGYGTLGIDARYVTFEPAPDDAVAAIRGGRCARGSGSTSRSRSSRTRWTRWIPRPSPSGSARSTRSTSGRSAPATLTAHEATTPTQRA